MALERLMKRDENRACGEFSKGYFKIDNVTVEGSKVRFQIQGFVDEPARRYAPATQNMGPMPGEGRAYVYEKSMDVPQAELTMPTAEQGDTPTSLLKKAIYNWLKVRGEWASALSV